jgi:cytochrome bd-type quinol oxidase subunit 1
MNYPVYYIAQIILSCIGIFFAYKILKCERVSSKWVLYSFIFLQVLSLIAQIVGLYLYIFKRNEFNKVTDKKSTPTPTSDSTKVVEIATLLTLLVIITIVCFIFNIYFLVKLFQCNTTWFGIYLVANIFSMIPNFI